MFAMFYSVYLSVYGRLFLSGNLTHWNLPEEVSNAVGDQFSCPIDTNISIKTREQETTKTPTIYPGNPGLKFLISEADAYTQGT